MNKPRLSTNQKGFTIVELMIATVVLTVILLLVTVMIISIGNIYYKGINEARIQDTTRSITTDVSQHLQLSQQIQQTLPTVPQPIGVLCIDTTRYSYVLGKDIGSASGDETHVLWRDTIPSAGSCLPATLTVANPDATGVTNAGIANTGSELISPDSRLTAFSVAGTTSPFAITVGVAFGDPTLTNTPSGANVVCNGRAGDQFCATASLTTTVLQRLTGTGN